MSLTGTVHDRELTHSSWLAIGLGLAVVAALITVVAFQAPLLIVGVIALVIGWAVVRDGRWHLVSSAVLFVAYSNAAAVAVRYHNVPGIVASAVFGLLLIPMAWHVVIRREPIVFGASLGWLAGLCCVQLLGALFADYPAQAWEEFIAFAQEALILYILITNVIRTPEALNAATWALLLAGCLMGAVPLYQQLTRTFDNEYGGFAQTGGEPGFSTDDSDDDPESRQKRLAGPVGEKNRYAQVMLMLVPLAVFLILSDQSWWKRGAAAVCLFLALTGVYLAFSRSSLVAGGLVVMFACAVNVVSWKKAIAVFGLAACGLLLTPEYQTRMASLLSVKEMLTSGRHSQADGALKGRATEMGAAVLVFADHPVVGVGPGLFKFYSREYGERIGLRSLDPMRQAHCLLLAVAAENGLPGLICICGIFWCVIRSLLLLRRRLDGVDSKLQVLASGYLFMVVTYFATGLFLHFAFIRYFWLMIALADAAIYVSTQRLNDPLESDNPHPEGAWACR